MKFLFGFITGVACSLLLFWILEKTDAPATEPVKSEQTQKEVPSAQPNDQLPTDFLTFYEQFHTDSAFQLNHIVFPLEGLPANVDSLTVANRSFRWQRDNWVLHRSFDELEEGFNKTYNMVSDEMIIEDITHQSGQYGMQRRFAKYEEGWFMIYYAAMNELAQQEE